MGKATVLLISVICALSGATVTSKQRGLKFQEQVTNEKVSEKVSIDQASGIRLTIATVGPMLGPPTDRYRVGEQVPITLSMTNTSTSPKYACVSSDLYQDSPTLTKDGQLVPYPKWQVDLLRNAQNEQTCQKDDLPERILLQENEPTVVDFLVLVDDSRLRTGALSWYDPLTPGVYELSVQRRLSCCDGPMIESNKISFEIAP